jgi:hypothetical protein
MGEGPEDCSRDSHSRIDNGHCATIVLAVTTARLLDDRSNLDGNESRQVPAAPVREAALYGGREHARGPP